jgi:hypothetical protein
LTKGRSLGHEAIDPADLGQDLRDKGATVNPDLDKKKSGGSTGSSGSGS